MRRGKSLTVVDRRVGQPAELGVPAVVGARERARIESAVAGAVRRFIHQYFQGGREIHSVRREGVACSFCRPIMKDFARVLLESMAGGFRW